MIPIHGLFETHLTVSDLQRSMKFYGESLGLELAQVFPERRVAFYWIGAPGSSMLGLWETGSSPQKLSLHIALTVDLSDLLTAASNLRAANITPLDFSGNPANEPVVLAWMPAASLYFHDPDSHLLEFLTMLPDEPQPSRGIVPWSDWHNISRSVSK
jgi:lactoylglutathione lyase